MSVNLFKHSQAVLDKMVVELWNTGRFASKVDRRLEAGYKMSALGKIGPKITCKKQRRHQSFDGLTYVQSPMTDQTFDVTIDQIKGVGLGMDIFEQTMQADGKITEKTSKDIKSAMNTLADQVDLSLAMCAYKNIPNFVGVGGTTPGSTSALDTQQRLADVRSIMVQAGVPENSKRMAFMDPKASGYVPASLSSLFTKEAQEAVRDGRIGSASQIDFYESANIQRPAVGTAISASGSIASGISTTALRVDGAGQTGASILMKSGTAGTTLKAGDGIYLDVYKVNIMNQGSFADLKQFVVTEDVTVAGDGSATVKVSPEIITSGAYQTVSASPADNATVYGYNTGMRNIIMIPETLALVCIPYEKLVGGVECVVATHEGLSIMMTCWANGNNLQQNARVDIAYGVAAQYGETGVQWIGQ